MGGGTREVVFDSELRFWRRNFNGGIYETTGFAILDATVKCALGR